MHNEFYLGIGVGSIGGALVMMVFIACIGRFMNWLQGNERRIMAEAVNKSVDYVEGYKAAMKQVGGFVTPRQYVPDLGEDNAHS